MMSNSDQTPGATTVNVATGLSSIPNIVQVELASNGTDLTVAFSGTDLTLGTATPLDPSINPGQSFNISIGSNPINCIDFQLNSEGLITLSSSGWSVVSSTGNSITITNSSTDRDSIADVVLGSKNTKGATSSCDIIIVGTVPIGDE